jgi:hypothetical protein
MRFDTQAQPVEHTFRGVGEENGYRLFPMEMETDSHTFFHGTAEENLPLILTGGFRSSSLASVSFAKSSSLALRYACHARSRPSGRGVIIAVRFERLDDLRIVQESFGVHVYHPDLQPRVVAYCFIPADYQFA